jgi:hypothetical protein
MKNLFVLAALAAALPAFAQSEAGSTAQSRAETAVSGNGIVTIQNQAQPANTYARFDGTTNQAASAPPVYVNAPSADTCERAGFGLSAGAVGGNAGINVPRGQSDKCDVRADTVNLRFVGAPAEVIKARHCMDVQLAEAYARAGMPCVDWREQQGPARPTGAIGGGSSDTQARRQPMPWQAGG